MFDVSPGQQKMVETTAIETRLGNYFVSNYPPFAEWNKGYISSFTNKLESDPTGDKPLGLYLHIPFCRKRCNFCYFKVYVDKDHEEIDIYLNSLIQELKIFADKPYIRSRAVDFVYIGGGTPSFLSIEQLLTLGEQTDRLISWSQAREISFEAEPGTLNREKLEAIKQIGVTRLSLGIESFSDHVLKANNRSHMLVHILNSYELAREMSFDQINIDLIAGLQGETKESWDESVQKALELSPDSVTIYQLEVPYNTTLYKQIRDSKQGPLLHSWDTKSSWASRAFRVLEHAGYVRTSAYTAVKNPKVTKFIYRDALWHGADLLALGVASFGHLGGSLYQNEKDFNGYISQVDRGALPVQRCYELSNLEAFIRELVLQLKLGSLCMDRFMEKFGIEIDVFYQKQLDTLLRKGFIRIENRIINVQREALLKVDDWLSVFYLPQHQTVQNSK